MVRSVLTGGIRPDLVSDDTFLVPEVERLPPFRSYSIGFGIATPICFHQLVGKGNASRVRETFRGGQVFGFQGTHFARTVADHGVPMSDLDARLTKAWLITHREEPDVRPLFDLSLNLRPSC